MHLLIVLHDPLVMPGHDAVKVGSGTIRQLDVSQVEEFVQVVVVSGESPCNNAGEQFGNVTLNCSIKRWVEPGNVPLPISAVVRGGPRLGVVILQLLIISSLFKGLLVV